MHNMNSEDILATLRNNKATLVRFGADRIGLFGSFARNQADESSDIDLLVEFSEGKKNYDNFIDLCFFLENLLGRPVDLITTASISPHLKKQISAEVRFEKLQ